MELLLGCGKSRTKYIETLRGKDWAELVTLDCNPAVNPDIVHDLNIHPLPFSNNMFDEIHSYQVLEHLGSLGDYRFFFSEFNEYWRILKPGGLFVASTPLPQSSIMWSDPGHTRPVTPEMLYFLADDRVREEPDNSMMTDYGAIRKCNFEMLNMIIDNEWSFNFIMAAVK